MPSDRAFRAALIFTLVAASFLLAVHGSRFVPTNDEGILLEPAQRIAAGQSPYVDFFGYMSPGSYWIQAAVFRIFGVSLVAGRIPVILDFSIQCGLLLWLVSRLATFRAAILTGLFFFGFQIADPSFLTAQHRWDSGTLALLAACLAYEAQRRTSPIWSAAVGMLLAAAAWCTPSMALAIVAVLAWFAWFRNWRAVAAATAGIAFVSASALLLLGAEGSLGAFVQQLLWLRRNYSEVNVMPYGSIIGGYGRIFDGLSGAAVPFAALFVFFIALPAILPPLAFILWAVEYRGRTLSREQASLVSLLLAVMVALTATAFPRADVMHLAFVAALPAALCGAAASRLLPTRAAGLVAVLFSLGALAFASNHIRAFATSVRLNSPAGALLVDREKSDALRQILSLVKPDDTLLVHPYMPVLYFATQGRNVSRFSFLAPGMMTSIEEREMLSSLRAEPPQWVLYQPISREEFLRVFPHAAGLENKFPLVDEFLAQHYEAAAGPPVQFAGYRLLQRKIPLANSLLPRP
ncbi:MAG: hypothetical protein ABI972_29085 [Acidobacteriota bacterium]